MTYALNVRLHALADTSDPARALLIADGNFVMWGPNDLACRHVNDGLVACFTDGHVEYIPYARAQLDDRLCLIHVARGEDTR